MTYRITCLNQQTGDRYLRFNDIETHEEAKMWVRWIKRFEPLTYPIIHHRTNGVKHHKIGKRENDSNSKPATYSPRRAQRPNRRKGAKNPRTKN